MPGEVLGIRGPSVDVCRLRRLDLIGGHLSSSSIGNRRRSTNLRSGEAPLALTVYNYKARPVSYMRTT
jgi:hypothetical protein